MTICATDSVQRYLEILITLSVFYVLAKFGFPEKNIKWLNADLW